MYCDVGTLYGVIAATAVCVDKTYMLKNYKTEPCPRWFSADSNRICRLGAMCPYYHSSKDRRRMLAAVKYRYIFFSSFFLAFLVYITAKSNN